VLRTLRRSLPESLSAITEVNALKAIASANVIPVDSATAFVAFTRAAEDMAGEATE
jgi:hypothetical protein